MLSNVAPHRQRLCCHASCCPSVPVGACNSPVFGEMVGFVVLMIIFGSEWWLLESPGCTCILRIDFSTDDNIEMTPDSYNVS
ncbi:hypothetical protein Plhal304r1_c026g0088031 [Plasmopara halstedii]